MAFSDVSTVTKVGFFGLCASLILFLTAFGSKYWLIGGIFGLWTANEYYIIIPGWFQAIQAMECLALIAGFAAVILLGLFMFLDSFYRNGHILTLAKVAPMAAGAFSMVGVVIFGAKVGNVDALGWSFWLCVVSSIFFFVFGGIVTGTRRPE